MSHVDELQVPTGVPHFEESGEPLLTLEGTEDRPHRQIEIPLEVRLIA